MSSIGSIEVSIGLLGIVIAAIALILDRRAQGRASQLEVSRYEHELEIQRTERITSWASLCSHVMSEADHFVCTDSEARSNEREKTRARLGVELSALVDQGRWLFHNWHPDHVGKTKHKLNHGFRDNRLDPLVSMYKLVMRDEAIDPHKQRKDFVLNIQKLAMPLVEPKQ